MKPISPVSQPMNKTEKKFADYLYLLLLAREIVDYKFQPMKFSLAENIEGGHNAVTYTPDFLIVHPDRFELVDTKAKTKNWSSMRDDARVKINLAAKLFPWFEWSVYYLDGKSWIKESISGPISGLSKNSM